MPTPDKPTLDYSYTAFAQGLGNGSFPGTQIDNDLANLKSAIDETIDFTSGVIRSDGKLANGIVTKASLDSSLALGVASPRPWAATTTYAVDDTVTINNSIYICTAAHTSASFASDFGAGLWGLVAEFTVPAAIADAAVTETKHATGGVSTRALADLSVTTGKIANGAVTTAKLAAATAMSLLPVGAELDFPGAVAPSGWLLEFGQGVSRSVYSALFAVLCPAFTCTTVNGSPVLTSVSADFRNLGLEGAVVEGANIPAGAVVVSVTASTITLSLNATGSAAGVAGRMFPWGAGDGSTTFNLPDARDRVSVGRGNMGGVAAGRVSLVGAGASNVDTSRVGAVGGVDRHTLVVGEMPSHAHTATSSVTDPGHTHGPGSGANFQNSSAGSVNHDYIGGSLTTTTSAATASATTGITVATTVNANGGGAAHTNIAPSRVVNKIIFTGVV